MTIGIYCIKNKIDGKMYIGQSRNVEARIREHFRNLSRRNLKDEVAIKRVNRHLWYAVKKYGVENFISFVLEECSEEDLSERERYYIKLYSSNKKGVGYNLSEGGDSPMQGVHHTQKTKDKISKANSGKNHPFYGKKLSKEHRKNISKNHADMSGDKNGFYGRHHNKKTKAILKSKSTGRKRKNATSHYYGVHKRKSGLWRAQITENARTIDIGEFEKEIDAAKAYNNYVIKNKMKRPLNILDNNP